MMRQNCRTEILQKAAVEQDAEAPVGSSNSLQLQAAPSDLISTDFRPAALAVPTRLPSPVQNGASGVVQRRNPECREKTLINRVEDVRRWHADRHGLYDEYQQRAWCIC